MLGLALLAGRAGAQPAAGDSLDLYLHQLADSTDDYFGAPTARFDTTGLDSLFAAGGIPARRRGFQVHEYPVLRYHRAEGAVGGAGARLGPIGGGIFDASGSYGFSNKQGRYAAGWRRTLVLRNARRAEVDPFAPGRIGDGTRLDFFVRYARETLPFMPEHAAADYSSSGALLTGESRQSVFESRGVTTGLEAWAGDWRFRAGFHHAQDQPMFLATRWSLLGSKERVVENVAAARDEYSEAVGGIAFLRRDWDLAGVLDARDGGGDRWRLRAVLGKGFRVTSAFRLTLQAEGGAAAALAPRQRRFEIGGPRAVPTLPYDAQNGDHLLLGKAELMYGTGLLEALGIGHPKWLVLQPFAFFQSGAAWDAGRDVVFSQPPSEAFQQATGIGLALRVGVPDPDTFARIFVAVPVGERGGEARVRFAIRAPLDLIGRL